MILPKNPKKTTQKHARLSSRCKFLCKFASDEKIHIHSYMDECLRFGVCGAIAYYFT